jgi:succinate-semialdehyde dehydrogenase/glutarate-semialdehyde dehydrogenase
MSLTARNPATGAVLHSLPSLDEAGIERKLARAAGAFRAWRTTPFGERARLLRAAAALLRKDVQQHAGRMALEMGKPLSSGRAEVEKSARALDYCADHGEALLADRPVELGGPRAFVTHLPLGAVLAVMPWNFPYWQVLRFAAPNLMAGNVGLLKHASNVPGCGAALEQLFTDAGFPEGVFQNLAVGSGAVAGIIRDARVAAVTLTGSTPAGQSVAAAAGAALKKCVLELGGSDPFLVLPSADVAEAARVAAQARILNAGQSCIAAKRFLVHAEVYTAFRDAFVGHMARFRVGDPLLAETEVGPLATAAIRDEVEALVEDAKGHGARVLCGGHRLPGPGYFYAPTVLEQVPAAARAFREELFGPVAQLFRVESLDEALRLANDSDFGLGSSVWTRDEAEAARCIRELEAGLTFVNGMVVSDPRLPFGGVKQSGHGRELGPDGFYEFVNRKSVVLAG